MEGGRWVEMEGEINDLIVDLVLHQPPRSLIQIAEGDDPTDPETLTFLWVPEWADA